MGYLIIKKSVEESTRVLKAHYYKDSSRAISFVLVKAFYVVPKDKENSIDPKWRELLDTALKDSSKFHDVQFHGLSKLNYEIYPQPVILEKEAIAYDTDVTDKGNPEGLKNIVSEIQRRNHDFLTTKDSSFRVIGILYEGVGASGTDGAFILSRTFLSDQQYSLFGASLFYHEFGHSLGLPDRYSVEGRHEIPLSNDIMGSGRRRPISINFIERSLLSDMGVVR